MSSRRLRWLLLTTVPFFSTIAAAQTLQTIETYKGTDPPGYCAAPPATSVFSSTDPSVNIYFAIAGLNHGDIIKVQWFNPAGVNSVYTPWNPVSGNSSQCFWYDFFITTYISPSWGTWQAQVTVNDTPLGSPISFQVNNAAPIQPRGPDYRGSFDPIPIDCSHLFGWAQDNNNSTATLAVDIAVSGVSTTTVQAGDFRSDVGNHAWNYYSLQRYEDGQQHQIHAYFSGTTQELPGSPRTFPPAGYNPSSCGIAPITPRGPVGVQWTTKPPSQFKNGDTFNVGWNISGGSQATYSHVHLSTDPNALKSGNYNTTSSGPGGGDGTYNQSFSPTDSFGSLAPGTTIYMLVHASDGNGDGVDYYSDPAQSTVVQTTTQPSSVSTWIYSPTNNANLVGMTVVLERQYVSKSTYQYSLSVVTDDTKLEPLDVSTSSLTITCKHSDTIKVHRTSLSAQLIYNIPFTSIPTSEQLLQSLDSAPWRTQSRANDNGAILLKDGLGLLPFVGQGFGYLTALGDVISMFSKSPAVGPSAPFASDLDSDDYDVYGASLTSGLYQMKAVRFVVNVDELGTDKPEFFLLINANNTGSAPMVSVEIRSDLYHPIIQSVGY